MRFLFLDNFRGFSNTSVPLLDVNFLVGENSTGKTSLLHMLRMFSGPQLFMASEDANDGDSIQFGHFSEMVSAHSVDQSYFRVGYVDENYHFKGRKLSGHGILLTYVKANGLAQVSAVTCTMPDGDVSVRIQNNRVFYKIVKNDHCANARDMNARLLEWVEEHKVTELNGWTELKPAPDEIRRVPLVMLLAIATSQTTRKPQTLSFTLPPVGPPLIWIAPIRTKPRRTYDEPQTTFSSEGSHIPYVIRRMLDSENQARKFKEFIERIGKASGLFQKIEIKKFGDAETSPFEVDAILDEKALSLGWLGYGVSQSLPIFVELLDRPKESSFAIQQPEVHLHPRAQACLGDVFFEMAYQDNKRFFIETHSDFTIDRFRLNYRKRRSKKDMAKIPSGQVLFFERRNKQNVITPLPISSRGELPDNQPESYRKFFVHEEMRILGIE